MPVVYAADVPASQSNRYPQSLSHSRSLRDLHRLLPPLSDKTYLRTVQLNNRHVIQDPCPPEAGASQPSRHQSVKDPSDIQRRTTALSSQVSSFATPPAAHPTDSSRSIRRRLGESHHKAQSESVPAVPSVANNGHPSIRPHTSPKGEQRLRELTADSRKARRYAGAFGLERSRPSLPTMRRPSTSPMVPTVHAIPDSSSLASTPLAMYTEGETDSDTDSIGHSLELSFPQPPPMDDYMHLRRMRSSPMFIQDESDIAKVHVEKRYVGLLQASAAGKSSSEYDQWDTDHLVNQTSLSFDSEKSLKLARHTVAQIGIVGSPHGVNRREKSPSSVPVLANDASRKRATVVPTRRERSEGVPLTHTRSLSHFRKDPSTMPNASRRVPTQLPSELSVSMDRLDLSMKKLKSHSSQEQPTGFPPTPSLPVLPIPNPPSLASAGRQKPPRRPRLSAPPPSKFYNIPPIPKNLGTHERTPRNHTTAPMFVEQAPPKSFIDITPEQNQRTSSREKMRKLFARASVSVLKTFKGKNGSR